jgi:hypothetical protein
MALTIIGVLLLLLFPPSAQGATPPVVTDPISAHLSPTQNLKAYALTVCFGDGFPADKTLEYETTRAARFYIDNGEFPIEAYNETYDLAHVFLNKNYLSEKGEKWTAMKCIDLLHSKEFAKLLQKYEKVRVADIKKYPHHKRK